MNENSMKSVNLIMLLVALLVLPLGSAAAQEDVTDVAKKAADTATEAQQTSEDARKSAQQAQQQADETAKMVEQATADAASKQDEASAVLQEQLDAQAALIAGQAASGESTDATLADLQRMLNEQKSDLGRFTAHAQ
jgi:uncharacterized protein YlxW (UPF0749 family)